MASLTSSTLYGSPISFSYQSSGSTLPSSQSRTYHPSQLVLCQQLPSDLSEQRTNKVPRRSIAVATVLAVLMESYSLQEARAARKKTVEAAEKRPEEDKSLSGYDAKLLATYRRKEAMKEALAKQKEKAIKTAAAKSTPKVKTAGPEVAEAEKPTASVAASASEAVKTAIETVLPSSE